MLIEFDEEVDLPVEEVYPYFRSPLDWPRLYGAFGEVEDRGQGWYAVPLRGFPFPLVARVTKDELLKSVQWTFEGFWRGEGQVSFVPTSRGVAIRGFERISPPLLLGLGSLVERLFLAKRFEKVWESGWRRLRRQAAGRSGDPAQPTSRSLDPRPGGAYASSRLRSGPGGRRDLRVGEESPDSTGQRAG